MTAHEIIAKFGGLSAVARLTGAKPTAVSEWRRSGIAAKYWPIFMELGISAEILRATKPRPVPQVARVSPPCADAAATNGRDAQ